MRDVSDRYRSTVASGRQNVEEVVEVLDTNGDVAGTLPIVSGEVTEDADAVVRTDFDLTVSDPKGTLIPHNVDDLLAPVDRRLRVRRGFRWAGVPSEAPTLATGWFSGVSAGAGEGTVRIRGLDRMARLQKPSRVPVRIDGGKQGDVAIRDLLHTVDPTVGFDLTESLWTFPQLSYEVETDIASQAAGSEGLAEAIGCELFVNRDDKVELRPVPTPTGNPVASFVEGRNCTVTAASIDWNVDDAHDGVILTAHHSSMTGSLRAEVWAPGVDPDNPSANPRFVSTEKATTITQLEAMGRAILQREVGRAHEVPIEIVPNPALETGDVVFVDLPSIGVKGLYVIARLSLALNDPSATMSLDLRTGVVE